MYILLQLLEFVAGTMLDARSRLSGSFQHSNTAQLLLIVSDGKMRDSLKSVEAAIQMLREANIFVVFVVLDNPDNKVFVTCSYSEVIEERTAK